MENQDGQESLAEQLDKLNKALEASKKTLTLGSALQIEDMSELSEKYLSEKARKDLSNLHKQSLILVDENKRVHKTVFFAVTTRVGNEEKGVAALAPAINELAEQNLITACLAPMATLKLAKMPMETHKSVVFCFVLVPAEVYEETKSKYQTLAVEEGGLGRDIEDTSVSSSDGEFFATVRVSSAFSMLSKEDPKEMLQKQIDQYLAVLPEGTVVREITACAITDLSVPYEVKFYNPLMQQVKSVDLDYVRSVAVVDEKLKQFNLFLGIRYFDANKKELYRG